MNAGFVFLIYHLIAMVIVLFIFGLMKIKNSGSILLAILVGWAALPVLIIIGITYGFIKIYERTNIQLDKYLLWPFRKIINLGDMTRKKFIKEKSKKKPARKVRNKR